VEALRLHADLRPPVDRLAGTLLAVALLVAVAFGGWLLRTATTGGPGHVQSVTLVNQTGLTLAVDAVDAGGTAVFLGLVEPGATVRREEVVDLGPVWVFVASYGGREVYRSSPLRRDQLAAQGWTVLLPPSPATRELEDAGFF
jgi:hypothetical protein